MPDCCLLKKEDTYRLVDNETFVKVKIIAKALPVNFFVLRKDLGEWNEAYRVYKGTGKACDTYEERDGNFVKVGSGKVLFDSNYPYMYGSEKGDYRKLKYVYESVDGEETFWVKGSVFTKQFKMLDSKKSCILESKLSENEIYAVKKELAENEEIEMDSGEISVNKKTINKYIDSKVVQTWVNVNVNGTDYWTDVKNISCEKGFCPIEQIPYNDWKRYFTEIDVQGIDKYKFKESEEHFKKLKFTDVQFEVFKKKKEEDSRNPVPRYRMAHFIKENVEQTDFYYFKNKTEWIADDKLTEMLCKEYPVFKDKLKKQREKYVFFDEARKLRSPGFPQGDTFWYFHPARFINHIDKVVTPPEINPYRNEVVRYYASPEDRAAKKLSYYTVKDNPGFSPVYTWGIENYTESGQRYACITGSFNEDYAWLPAYEKWKEFYHEGLDLRGYWNEEKYKASGINEKGTPIKALINCKVIAYGWYSGYGQVIFMRKKTGVGIYLLAHLSFYDDDIYEGKEYKPGDIVAYTGGSGQKNGKYALDAWEPHLHISYYDLEFSKKIVINTENNIISITNGVYKELVNNRKNPFVHNSEPRKPKIDQEGHVIP